MAGMDWFRWHHGSVTDPKFALIARKAGASVPDVLAVWAYILETASQSVERGDFGAIDCEALDCVFGFPSTETRTEDILKAMQARALVDGTRVAAWEKRQPKREREDATNADRQATFKAKQNQVTPDNANSSQKTPREDKSREDKKEEGEAAGAATSPPVGVGLFDEFWKAYPNKTGKDAARKAFDKRKPKRELLDSMLAALDLQRASKKWTDDGGQYIPNPSTWLNEGRWMDEASALVAEPADFDSRVAIEKEGVSKGVGAWDAITEQWPAYKARVRAAPRSSGFDLSGLAALAAKRQGATA